MPPPTHRPCAQRCASLTYWPAACLSEKNRHRPFVGVGGHVVSSLPPTTVDSPPTSAARCAWAVGSTGSAWDVLLPRCLHLSSAIHQQRIPLSLPIPHPHCGFSFSSHVFSTAEGLRREAHRATFAPKPSPRLPPKNPSSLRQVSRPEPNQNNGHSLLFLHRLPHDSLAAVLRSRGLADHLPPALVSRRRRPAPTPPSSPARRAFADPDHVERR